MKFFIRGLILVFITNICIGCNVKTPFLKKNSSSTKINFASDSGGFDSAVLLAYNIKFRDSQLFHVDSYPKGKLNLRMKLDSLQIESMAAILNDTACEKVADCYNPHHAILFYKEGKVNAYYEFCLECGNASQYGNLNFPKFCLEKAASMSALLRTYGVTFYTNEPNGF